MVTTIELTPDQVDHIVMESLKDMLKEPAFLEEHQHKALMGALLFYAPPQQWAELELMYD